MAAHTRADRVCGVLQQHQPALLGEVGQLRQLAGVAAVPHVDNRPRGRADRRLAGPGGEPRLERARDIGEDGVAPAYRTAFAVATKVSDGTITSSPGPRPAARHIRCRAAVPLETAQACGTPTYSANAASNSDVRGPMLSQPERYVAATASMSASVTRTSASGTFQAVIVGHGRLGGR